jgi:hypothetical protein
VRHENEDEEEEMSPEREQWKIAKEAYTTEMDRITAMRVDLAHQECVAIAELEYALYGDEPAVLEQRARWHRGEI